MHADLLLLPSSRPARVTDYFGLWAMRQEEFAGLWMTAAIGVAAGLGREMTAVLATLLAFAILALEQPLMRLIRKSPEGGKAS